MSKNPAGISQSLPTVYGVSASHWVVRNIFISTNAQTLAITLVGFSDAQAHNSGKASLDEREFSASGPDYASLTTDPNGILSAVYAWILLNAPEFSGGVSL